MLTWESYTLLPNPSQALALRVTHGVQKRRTFPDGGARVKGQLPYRGMLAVGLGQKREQGSEAVLQGKLEVWAAVISWDEFKTPHSCWEEKLA